MPPMPPPLLRTRIPHYPQGGPVYTLEKTSQAAAWLRSLPTTPQGRVVCAHDPDGAFCWTGRARRGETFGFFAWADHTLVVWAPHKRTRLLSPVLLRVHQADLGALGQWELTWDGTPTLSTWKRWRHHDQALENPIPLFSTTIPSGKQARARAIVHAALLQALSDHIHHTTFTPVVDEATPLPPKGWSRPIWHHPCPQMHESARQNVARQVLTPVVARAYVHGHLSGPQAFAIDGPTRDSTGTLASPILHCLRESLAPSPIAQEALKRWDRAWKAGVLGTVWDWYAPPYARETALRIDPASLSRHTLLAAAAQTPHSPFPSGRAVPT